MSQTNIVWKIELDEMGRSLPKQVFRIDLSQPRQMKNLLSYEHLKEECICLKNELIYHFVYRSTDDDICTKLIIYKTQNGMYKDLKEETDTEAIVFAQSHYFNQEDDDYEHGQLNRLNRSAERFMMDQCEETFQLLCFDLFECMHEHAGVYVNAYQDDMKNRDGNRLLFTGYKATQWSLHSSKETLPLEWIIRDVAQDDSSSKGIYIATDNPWFLSAYLPKDVIKEVYSIYLQNFSLH